MFDQLLDAYATETFKVFLQVSFCRLTSVADRHSDVLVVITAGTRLKQMRTSLIDRAYQESDTKWTLRWVASLDLAFLANLGNQAFTRMATAVRILVIETFVAHHLCEETRVSSHS